MISYSYIMVIVKAYKRNTDDSSFLHLACLCCSEQKLIRQKVDVVPISATIETEDGLRVPVKLLDCDTISQAKEKLLDCMYKAAPVSKRSKLTEVDLGK